MTTDGFFNHDPNNNMYRTIDGLQQNQENQLQQYYQEQQQLLHVQPRNLSASYTLNNSYLESDNTSAIQSYSGGSMNYDCMNYNYNENISYLNVSCETILSYSVPLYGYCTPFLLLTTVTANTLIVLVLSKRNMATPTNLVLMGKLFPFC